MSSWASTSSTFEDSISSAVISAPTISVNQASTEPGPMSSMTEYSVCPPTSTVGSASGRNPIWSALLRTARGWQSRYRPSAAFRAFPRTTACRSTQEARLRRARSFANIPIEPAPAEQRRGQAARAASRRQAAATGSAASTASFKSDARIITRVRTRRRRDRARCGRRQGDSATRQRAPRAPERPSHQRSDAPPASSSGVAGSTASGCATAREEPFPKHRILDQKEEVGGVAPWLGCPCASRSLF